SHLPFGALGLAGQTEGALTDDVLLDLTGAGVGGSGATGEEDVLPLVGGVPLAVGTNHRVGAYDVEGDLTEDLVVLAPEQLRDRRLGSGLAALGQRREESQARVSHQLHLGVAPGQTLTDQGVMRLPVFAG